MTNDNPNKLKIRTMILTGVTVGLAVGLSSAAVQYVFFRKPTFDKQLVAMANEINKTCPIMVNAQTRLDSTAALPERQFLYLYTLVKMASGDVDRKKLSQKMRPKLINMIRTTEEMKTFRDERVTLIYNYRDKSGASVARIEISPSDYQRD